MSATAAEEVEPLVSEALLDVAVVGVSPGAIFDLVGAIETPILVPVLVKVPAETLVASKWPDPDVEVACAVVVVL